MSDSLDISSLSARERQIAQAYANGATYREIAENLHIAPTTVRTHVRTIYRKLGVSSKLELYHQLENPSEWTERPVDPTTVHSATAARPSLPDIPSIAVLPFANMSEDPEQSYFSDGITEDIITALSRFSSLFVIAHSSSFAFVDRSLDVTQIASELGVRYLLKGSIRRAGDRVRVTAQLIDSRTGNHIWAERYDRVVEDIFDVQEELTRHVATSLVPQIEMAEIARVRDSESRNFSAYDLALKAKAILFEGIKSIRAGRLEQAIEAADEVLKIDPRNVQALWTKGFAYHMLYTLRPPSEADQVLAQASEVIKRLSEIDSANPYCCMILGVICWDRGEHEQALSHMRRGYELNPNFAWNLFSLAWAEALAGLTEEAVKHAELGLRLSPRDMDFWLGVAHHALALAYFADGNYREAKKLGQRALEYMSEAPVCSSVVISSCSHLGELDEAAQRLRDVRTYGSVFLNILLNGDYSLFAIPEKNALFVNGIKMAVDQA